MAFFRLGRKGLVLQVKAHDDVGPFLPDAVAVLASVVYYCAQTGVEEVFGVLVFVKVAASEPAAVCVVAIYFLNKLDVFFSSSFFFCFLYRLDV